jgi:hypothetical protein
MNCEILLHPSLSNTTGVQLLFFIRVKALGAKKAGGSGNGRVDRSK